MAGRIGAGSVSEQDCRHLGGLAGQFGVRVLPGQFSLPGADKAFDEANGALKSPARRHNPVPERVNTAAALKRA